MTPTRGSAAVLIAAFCLLFAPAADAIDLSVDFGGVDGALACTDPGSCLSTATYTIGPDSPYAATGTVTIDDTLLQMSFNLSLVSLIMNSTVGPGQAQFQSMTYTGSGIALDGALVGGPTLFSWVIDGSGAALLGGNVLIDTVAGTLPSNAGVTGSCATFAPGITAAPACGFTFTFDLDVNPGGSADVQQFKHTMNFTMVPEPEAAVMLGLGLAGLAFIRRKRA